VIIEIIYKECDYQCDLSKPLDISISLGEVKCFNAPDVTIEPFISGDFVGSVKAGAPVNFFNVSFNPHGNGTHTESMGHITEDQESITDQLRQYHFIAQVISTALHETAEGDLVIMEEELKNKCGDTIPEALVIRTLPNPTEKKSKDYSGANPPYLSKAAMEYIVRSGVKHLLIDLPSIDREDDGGKLMNHKLFWNLKSNRASESSLVHHTITELIFVPDDIEDGLYLLNIQLPSIDLDAAPSKPVLYQLTKSHI